MKKILLGLGVLVVLGVGVVIVGHPSAQKGSVSLGVIAGVTGDYAAAGEGYVKGFELAREEWNKSHALQFEAVFEDDGFNAQKGVAAYNKIKSVDKPDAYAIVSSFTIDAIADNLHQEGLPVALGFEQGVAATDDNIFQVFPAARPIMEGLGKQEKSDGYKKPLVLFSNNSPVYQNFVAGFVDGYGEDVVKEVISGTDGNTIRAAATRALADRPDSINFFMDPPAGALLAKEILLQSKGNHPPFVFDQSIQSGKPDYEKVFGKGLAALDESMVVLSRNDLTQDFKTLYKNKYQSEPPFGADIGYNSFELLASTYASSPQTWIKNMKQADFVGADGKVLFNQVGLRVPNLAFGTLKNGEVVLP